VATEHITYKDSETGVDFVREVEFKLGCDKCETWHTENGLVYNGCTVDGEFPKFDCCPLKMSNLISRAPKAE
jgi:hypothetical protein